ncbi:MAG: 3'(2'),5'-bisphosphate nucleotidase CysQ [Alphaproteobacteria bacterium]|nr:3'(2'),5'-bisphosphate nucleotidase CysQ [Alphaproteobacteria bacterium]
MPNQFAPMLPAVCDIARHAGAAIMEVYATDFSAARKADGSPVTEADTAAEAIILPALRTLTPDIAIVSEEHMADGAAPDISSGNFWLVDPLDGTREFMKRNDEFTVNIGLIIDLEPVFGVLYAPALDTMFFGAGTGSAMRAQKDGDAQPIACREISPDGIGVLVSRSHSRNERLDDYLADKNVRERLPRGSALKFGVLAAGEADLYPRFGPTSEWDTAAGHAIVRAAGGDLETFDGQPFAYGKVDKKFLNPGFVAFGRR